MRQLLLAAILPSLGCASTLRTPCEFTVKVRVLDADSVDSECRRVGAKFSDDGLGIDDSQWILGCAPEGEIIMDGSVSTAVHEIEHQIDQNCRQPVQ